MSDNLIDLTLKQIFNNDLNKLSNSHLYNFYDKIINDINIKCDNIYFRKVKIDDADINDETCKLWGIVYKILDNWNNCNKFSNINPKKCCDYFNYWLYGELKKDVIYNNISNIKIIYKAWDSFFNELADKKICYIRK
ncbi:hypothetical protein PVX_000025 [Plasmodium vivax]|uniref:PIR Superfamily Protein n=1 Tax=Plasmodium vivax (strain Salvador I) TaxID=126793 RepID=A5KCS3_PLAVS|nr:hypothetical protein PVX_000025 [Plasmodium vivax]EDL42851.1 hypothetical protein PVX_000025 [Plasmodium vivax]|eukprot:XP_001612625.1 hypothetical protein [Plasmodium vivax Sal-1]